MISRSGQHSRVSELSADEQLTVYSYILGKAARVGKKYKAPPALRGTTEQERTPSFLLFRNRIDRNVILCKDFGGFGFSGDIYDLIMAMPSSFPGVRDFVSAAQTVNRILGRKDKMFIPEHKNHQIIILKKPTVQVQSTTQFQWSARKWADYDVEFFSQFGIHQQGLETYLCEPVLYFEVTKGNFQRKFVNTPKEPIYTFDMGNGHRRFYRPLSDRKQRFWSNAPAEVIFGMNVLPPTPQKIGVLAAGQKDCLSGFCNSDIWHVSINSETGLLTPMMFVKLKKAFNVIIPVYDNDLTGGNNQPKLVQMYNLPDVKLPDMPPPNKDIADYNRLMIEGGVPQAMRKFQYLKTIQAEKWLKKYLQTQSILKGESSS